MAATAAVAGCQKGGTPAPVAPTTPGLSAPTSSEGESIDEQALASYANLLAAYAKAGRTANPDEPDLANYATGNALKTLRTGLSSYRAKNQVIKGAYGSSPRVTATSSPGVETTMLTITDCLDGANFLVYKKSGGLANNTPGGRHATTALVRRVVGGTWKVTDIGIREVGSCT
jgi:hypothetical protein